MQKIAVIFGGSANEHEVSVVSAASVIKNLDKSKYEITPIYLDKSDNFYKWNESISNIKPLKIGILPTNLEEIKSPFDYLKNFDVLFLMIHGKHGEDGTLSGIFDFFHFKYVGNKALASLITMDKILTKEVLEDNNVKTAKYLTVSKYNNEYLYLGNSFNFAGIKDIINNNLKYPIFVKPAKSGSSLGTSRVNSLAELNDALEVAFQVDNRVLIEEMVVGREIECGILERKGEIIASVVGEVKAADTFYSFDAKYQNMESKTIIPIDMPENDVIRVQELAKKIFKILDCHGYSRVDLFFTEKGEIILNEINTIPGFTEISMYPKLFEASGISYSELLDILIEEVS